MKELNYAVNFKLSTAREKFRGRPILIKNITLKRGLILFAEKRFDSIVIYSLENERPSTSANPVPNSIGPVSIATLSKLKSNLSPRRVDLNDTRALKARNCQGKLSVS